MARRDTFGQEYRKIIAILAERRQASGVTQIELAKALDTDQSRISKIERCERRLDLVDYVRLCRTLDIDPGEPLRSIKP